MGLEQKRASGDFKWRLIADLNKYHVNRMVPLFRSFFMKFSKDFVENFAKLLWKALIIIC